MIELFQNIGASKPEYLEAGGGKLIAVSLEPGNGTIKHGTVLYRKANSVFYAPAAATNITTDTSLVILREDTDTDASATVAAAAAAYVNGEMLAKDVVLADGVTNLTAAQAHILHKQGFILSPFDDLTVADETVDNTATVSVTVTNDGHGTGTASPATGTKGTEVTLTATPSSGYVFDAWEVVSGGVTIENNKFIIGDAAVTVKATFKTSA